ncbi:MAG: hypothetical protein KDM64_03200 [Verrucomicrobiae bacterium]|nr:hypothetical protein [Verrucomicrobiae bacterium]
MQTTIRSLFRAVSMGMLALVLSHCAGGQFNQDWNAAVAARQSSAKPDPVTGPWTGTWLSQMNGHHGNLRCLVEPVEATPGAVAAAENLYRFRYHATWGNLMRGGFKADFPVVKEGRNTYLVKGTKKVGLFGDFDHDGKIVGDSFNANYASDVGDHGTFEMKRP